MPTDTTSAVVISRPDYKFQPGKSGNPAGRPKGSKNAVTLVKLAIEGELREEMKGEMSEILKRGIRLAKEGDTDMIRYFLDKWITPARASPDEDAPREKIQINISRLENRDPVTVQGRTLEHETTPHGQ